MRELFSGIFMTVLRLSLTGSFVCIVVCLLRLALKRAPKVFAYGLWALVFLRFACPIVLDSPVSVIPEWDSLWNAVSQAAQGRGMTGGGESGRSNRAEQPAFGVNAALGEGQNAGPAQTLPSAPANTGMNPAAVPDERTGPEEVLPQAEASKGETGKVQTAVGLLSAVWLCGIAALLVCQLYKGFLWRRYLGCVAEGEERICESPSVSAPFVMGLRRPRIYLPAGLSEEAREFILLHESIHVRRRDYLVKRAAFAVVCVHWFNPFAWLAWRLMCMDMELSCDEAVLKQIKGQRKRAYARTLMAFSGSSVYAGHLAFGEPYAKKRVRHVLEYQRPVYRTSMVLTVVCLAASGCLLTDPAVGRGAQGGEDMVPGKEALLSETQAVPSPDSASGALTDIDQIPAEAGRAGDGRWVASGTENEQVLVFLTDYLSQPQQRVFLELGVSGSGYLGMDIRELDGRDILQLARLLAETVEPEALTETETAALSQAGANLDGPMLRVSADTVRRTFEEGSGLDFKEEWITDYFGGWYSHDGSFYLEDSRWELRDTEPLHCTRAYVDEESLLHLCYTCEPAASSGETDKRGEAILTKEDGSWRFLSNSIGWSGLVEPVSSGEDADAYLDAQVAWWDSYTVGSDSPEITRSSHLWEADLTHDGQAEQLVFDWGYFDSASFGIFAVLDADGRVLHELEPGAPHVGWMNLYLCRLDGRDYILEYYPGCFQGWYDYEYELYWLNEEGEKTVEDSGSVSFYGSEGEYYGAGERPVTDIPAMVTFAETVNSYMQDSFLLVSTDKNAIGDWPSDALSDLFISSTPDKPVRLWETFGFVRGEAEPRTSEKPNLSGLAEELKAWCESLDMPYMSDVNRTPYTE